MGTYYRWENRDKKEYIYPGDIGCGCQKWHWSVFGDPAKILTWHLATAWRGDLVVLTDDHADSWLDDSWTNVTKEAIKSYNECKYDKDPKVLTEEEYSHELDENERPAGGRLEGWLKMHCEFYIEPWVPEVWRESIREWIERWSYVIPIWVDRLTLSSSEDDAYVAAMTVQEEYRAATLTIGKEWAHAATNNDLERIILHELCHLYTTPLAARGIESIQAFFPGEETPGMRIARSSINRACERATEDLASCLWGLRRNNQS